MKLKILCPQWGSEHLEIEAFLEKVKEAGYDGIDTWLPENKKERLRFIRLLNDYDLSMVSHQHQAKGNNMNDFCKSFEYYLNLSLESNPILINSHTGRDHFTLEEQLQLIDVAENFSVKKGVRVAHETHRGRIGFGPVNSRELFALRPEMKITADFSHWVCVTESYLENFEKELNEAIKRTEHIHARVGFPEGPQIPDPRSPYWEKQVDYFLKLWGRILDRQRAKNTDFFTITPEFGPQPYMWSSLDNNAPVADQWEINLFMKSLLLERFSN